MKKSIVKLGLVTALSASLFGFTYEIKQGWQQLGALEDLNSSDLSAFNDKCVNYLWFYDNNDSSNPQWKLHIANGNDYDYCGETLTSLKKGQGFWANAKADCNISIGTTPDKPCVSDMPAPPDLEKPECMTCNTDKNTSTGNNSSVNLQPPANSTEFTTGHEPLPHIMHPNEGKPVYYFGASSLDNPTDLGNMKEGDIVTVIFNDMKIQLIKNAEVTGRYLHSDVLIINDKTYKVSDYASPAEFDAAMRAIIPDDIEGPANKFMKNMNSEKSYKVYFTSK